MQLEMAEECLSHARDLSGLLLLYSALGDAEGITRLADLAEEQGKKNVAFLCLFLLGKLEECLHLLVDRYICLMCCMLIIILYNMLALWYLITTLMMMIVICNSLYSKRIPEAALMARSYLPSKVSEIVATWKNDLHKVHILSTISMFTSNAVIDLLRM